MKGPPGPQGLTGRPGPVVSTPAERKHPAWFCSLLEGGQLGALPLSPTLSPLLLLFFITVCEVVLCFPAACLSV